MSTTPKPVTGSPRNAAWMLTLSRQPATNRSETEAWLETLGSRFVEVHFYTRRDGHLTWLEERHIDDPETLFTTICMSLERLGGRFAVHPDRGDYVLVDARERTTKLYGSREAAEMVAMHRAD